ncbi:hypothetical protein EVG20_g4791 [Dentipellis fragilis]|uniref:Uncharacterized protein n=1 Tax=Dentipellis fragilis TaxID=205917 RepID=A0A4Y9YYU3_9AGAM|nr:hypothetical protein EVG20_g4791 [Dentipellis fragilis]
MHNAIPSHIAASPSPMPAVPAMSPTDRSRKPEALVRLPTISLKLNTNIPASLAGRILSPNAAFGKPLLDS